MEPDKTGQKDATVETTKTPQSPTLGVQIVSWIAIILLLTGIGWGVLYYIRMVADAFAITFSSFPR